MVSRSLRAFFSLFFFLYTWLLRSKLRKWFGSFLKTEFKVANASSQSPRMYWRAAFVLRILNMIDWLSSVLQQKLRQSSQAYKLFLKLWLWNSLVAYLIANIPIAIFETGRSSSNLKIIFSIISIHQVNLPSSALKRMISPQLIDKYVSFGIQNMKDNNKAKQKIFEMSDHLQNGSNVVGSMVKNPSSEQMKHMQWGVAQPHVNQSGSQVNYPRRYPFSREIDQNTNRNPSHQYPQDGNRYYIEKSQVSAIETGFKKLKTNQIQILKQLKKEYEVLRNSSLDSRVLVNKRNTSESQSNADSISQSQSSFASKNRQSRHKKMDNNELKMANLEKKQLQLMLNNSMKKIEELLHNEIDLKKNILQLKTKLQSNKISESEHDIVLRKSKETEALLQKIVQDLKKENQSLKSKVKELILNIGNLQGNINIKQVQLKKKQQRMKILEEQNHLQRNKYSSLELDLKKLKMEYDILEKSKNQEISLLMKNRHNIEQMATAQKNSIIKKLKEQLQVKQQRYHILLNKLNKDGQTLQTQNPVVLIQRQQQKQYNRNLQKLIQTLKEQKSHQNSQSINLIMSKLTELQHRPDQNLLLELNNLRHQLELMKQSHTISQTERTKQNKDSIIHQYEQKIRQLQKVIEEENIQKMYFMEDLKKLTKDYSNLKREKQQLIRDQRQLRSIIDRLQSQNRRYKNEIDMIKNVNVDLTESQHQNKNLMVKLQHMNLREIEINNVREEYNKRIDQFKLRQQNYEEQLRITKRKLNEEEFKVFKEHEQGQLKVKLLNIQHQNEMNRLQDELQRVKKAFALQKSDLINEKILLEKKLLQKTKQLEEYGEKIAMNLKEKDGSLQKLKSEHEFLLKREQQLYTSEINALVARIQSLSAGNEHLMQQSHRYALIQQQMAELKKHMRMNRKLTQTVDHLWQVKETQYSNINDILKLCK